MSRNKGDRPSGTLARWLPLSVPVACVVLAATTTGVLGAAPTAAAARSSGTRLASASPPKVAPSEYALAKHQWELGAAASAAAEGGNWVAAATDLKKAVAAKAPDASGYAQAATELVQLAKLPDAMQTPEQQKEAFADVEALNTFFGTNGLYGVNAPSTTPAAFVATLQQEARLGTLSVVADARLGTAPGALPGAIVTCPVLSSLAVKAAFGCKAATPAVGTYYFVGTVESAHATSYLASIVKGEPLFVCTTDGLDLAEELAAKRLGGGCR